MFAHIRTPLLRFFCIHSGVCGIQLTPIRLHQPASVLLFLWNIFYNISIFWGFSRLQLINADTVISGCTPNSKTLFAFLIHHSQKLNSYSQVIIISYFLVYGRKVVAALDSEQFQFVYRSKRMAMIIFGTNFAWNHFSIGAFLTQAGRMDIFLKRNLWDKFCTVTGYYSMFSYIFWLYNIIHYYQYAISRSLRHLEEGFISRNMSSGNVLAQVQSLALVSKQINLLLSLPFLFYLSLTAYSIVLSLSTCIICTPQPPVLFFTAIGIAYLTFLVLLSQKNGQAVSRLLAHIQQRIDAKERDIIAQQENCSSENDAEKHLLLKSKFLSSHQCLQCHFQRKLLSVTSRRVKLTECENLYKAYMNIRIFQMSVLNSGTLWQAMLFLLLYIILFSQTVKEMDD